MSHPSALAAKVAAVNRAHKVLQDLYPVFLAAFAPFMGCKVLKTSGGLMAKVNDAMPEIIGKPGLQVWLQTGNTGVYLSVKAWENSPCVSIMGRPMQGEVANYHETGAYLCSLDIADFQTARPVEQDHVAKLRTDYTAKGIEDARGIYERARHCADEAKSALAPFGEYDR